MEPNMRLSRSTSSAAANFGVSLGDFGLMESCSPNEDEDEDDNDNATRSDVRTSMDRQQTTSHQRVTGGGHVSKFELTVLAQQKWVLATHSRSILDNDTLLSSSHAKK